MGREDRAHAHQVEVRQMGVPQRYLEARELLLVPTNALGEKGLGGHEHSRVDQPVTSLLAFIPRRRRDRHRRVWVAPPPRRGPPHPFDDRRRRERRPPPRYPRPAALPPPAPHPVGGPLTPH